MWDNLYLQWSEKNNTTLNDYSEGSKYKPWWKCEKNHEWQASIVSRNSKRVGCPYCKNRIACSDNSLESLFPHLVKEWHPTKNDLKPGDVVFGSHRKIWWKCKKNHEWQATVVKRTSNNRNCPYCSNQKVCSDNSLESLFPHLVKEWHPTKNELKPGDVVFGSCKKIWWLCQCGFSWRTSPAKRTKQNTGCPICKSSKGEQIISKYLKHENIRFVSQHKFEDCRNRLKLPFDFYLPDLNCCIEFQGEQHYKPISCFGGVIKFEQTQKRDKIKKAYCKKNNIKLLAIPYWKICCIGNILKEFIYD